MGGTQKERDLTDKLWDTSERLAKEVGNMRVVNQAMQDTSGYLDRRVRALEELERPCPEFQSHLEEHAASKKRWRDRFWVVALRGVSTAVVGAAIAIWTHVMGIWGKP